MCTNSTQKNKSRVNRSCKQKKLCTHTQVTYRLILYIYNNHQHHFLLLLLCFTKFECHFSHRSLLWSLRCFILHLSVLKINKKYTISLDWSFGMWSINIGCYNQSKKKKTHTHTYTTHIKFVFNEKWNFIFLTSFHFFFCWPCRSS